MEKSRSSTLDLRNRALLGICIIIGFILVSQLIINSLIVEQVANSRVINLAGRQRMLSQQLTKDVLILQYTSDTTTRLVHIEELRTTLQIWELTHQGLQEGDFELGLPGSNSQSVTILFSAIEEDYQQIVAAGNCILAIETNTESPDCDDSITSYIDLVLLHEKDFLAGMNEIVFQYDAEARAAIDYTRYFSYILAIVGCIGVVGIWFGVLRPAIQRVQMTHEQLQKQSDALAQARDEALYAANIKSQILMNISHDARTPLTSIIISADMIARTDQGTLSERQHQRLNVIIQNAKRLNTFLQNLLDQSKLQTNSVQLITEPIQADKLYEELNYVLQPLAESKGLQWELSNEANFPTTIYGDRTRILQILTNLAHNAIKFTEQGRVNVCFVLHDEDYWGFRVKDTGKGMSAEEQDKIFDQFWQADGSTTRQNQSGVGLGLAIVKALIDLMDGHILVKSEIDKGTEFEVWLPIQDDNATGKQ
ncbi:MAG: ATP-binding protein [Chloroflexota bacterium]